MCVKRATFIHESSAEVFTGFVFSLALIHHISLRAVQLFLHIFAFLSKLAFFFVACTLVSGYNLHVASSCVTSKSQSASCEHPPAGFIQEADESTGLLLHNSTDLIDTSSVFCGRAECSRSVKQAITVGREKCGNIPVCVTETATQRSNPRIRSLGICLGSGVTNVVTAANRSTPQRAHE